MFIRPRKRKGKESPIFSFWEQNIINTRVNYEMKGRERKKELYNDHVTRSFYFPILLLSFHPLSFLSLQLILLICQIYV
jgi:hypothetical protein